MAREVVAMVTGLVRNQDLMEASFATLLALKQQKVIDRILYVTWDRADIDPLLAPLAKQNGITIIREPEPAFGDCAPYRKGFRYQQRNLATALAAIDNPDALVVKLRPDFVIDPTFLATKIVAFDYLCAPSTLAAEIGLPMPPSPFKQKIWVPWADASMPFFCEDGAYMGLRCDVGQLATPAGEDVVMKYGDAASSWAVHVARFAPPFLRSLPIFQRFLEEMSLFVQDEAYRQKMWEVVLGESYFWHLLYANAWALATSFHIDCGYPGQIHFFPSKFVAGVTRRDLRKPAKYSPYNAIEGWRAAQVPGGLTPCILRAFARLMDDSWSTALFKNPTPPDLTAENRRALLGNLIDYRSGVLADIEDAFYTKLGRFYRENWTQAAA